MDVYSQIALVSDMFFSHEFCYVVFNLINAIFISSGLETLVLAVMRCSYLTTQTSICKTPIDNSFLVFSYNNNLYTCTRNMCQCIYGLNCFYIENHFIIINLSRPLFSTKYMQFEIVPQVFLCLRINTCIMMYVPGVSTSFKN